MSDATQFQDAYFTLAQVDEETAFMNGLNSLSGNGKGFNLMLAWLTSIKNPLQRYVSIISCIMCTFTPLRLIATGMTKSGTKGAKWKVGSAKHLPQLDQDSFEAMGADEGYKVEWERGGAKLSFTAYRAKLGEYSHVNVTMMKRVAYTYLEHVDPQSVQHSIVNEYFDRFKVRPSAISKESLMTLPKPMSEESARILLENTSRFGAARKHWATLEMAEAFTSKFLRK
jgi:hypothetical protein